MMPASARKPTLWTALPAHVRFLLGHGAAGFGLSALLVAGLLWWDAFGLGRLLLDSASHPLPLLLLWFFSGLTLGSIQMGIAVMELGEDGDDGDRIDP